jgi:hypothetical protein
MNSWFWKRAFRWFIIVPIAALSLGFVFHSTILSAAVWLLFISVETAAIDIARKDF